MAWTAGDVAQLVGLLPGLDPRVAAGWFAAENADEPTNPFGILYSTDYASNGSHTAVGSSGRFAVFASRQAGIAAAAHLVQSSIWAAGIRAAIASGNATMQRLAIIASPWAGGHYVHGAGFPSLTAESAYAGTLGANASTGAPAATYTLAATPPAGGCYGVTPLAVERGLLGDQGIFPIPRARLGDPCACPPGYERRLYDPQIQGMLGTNYVPKDQLTAGQANACAKSSIAPGSVGLQSVGLPGDPGQALGQGIAAFGQGLVVLAANGAVLVTILALGWQGVRMTVGAATEA